MTGDLPRRAIWLNSDGRSLSVIDQTRLPHDLVISRLDSLDGPLLFSHVSRPKGDWGWALAPTGESVRLEYEGEDLHERGRNVGKSIDGEPLITEPAGSHHQHG